MHLKESELSGWIVERIPVLRGPYETKVREHYECEPEAAPVNAFFVFDFIIRPHVEDLLGRGEKVELQHIFDLLEWLAVNGDSSIRMEINTTMECIDLWRVWRFLGPTMRSTEREGITWIPGKRDRSTEINVHVDRNAYKARWSQEIGRIGGIEKLTTAAELYIRYNLVQEFEIEDLRAPEPGGDTWIDYDLPWPYSPYLGGTA
jgi:hypothetical protein